MNAEQLDADRDGTGDACETDKDNDGVENSSDNCPIVANADQLDSNHNGIGDACENDFDGDSFLDAEDVCPCNNYIQATDFRGIQTIGLGDNPYGQAPPQWEFRDEGREIFQSVNSAPGIAIGGPSLAGVEFEGTFYMSSVGLSWLDNDWVGAIFAFQVT